MSTLKERIGELMRETELSVGELADAARVSSSAVSQWANGQTQSIRIEAAILLERRTGFSALWLSKGTGIKRLAGHAAVLHPSLDTALTVLGESIASAPDGDAKRGAIQMLKTFVESPAANADLLPLIAKRLGEGKLLGQSVNQSGAAAA